MKSVNTSFRNGQLVFQLNKEMLALVTNPSKESLAKVTNLLDELKSNCEQYVREVDEEDRTG